MIQHEGIKEFVCPFEGCKKAYSQKCRLSIHVRTHEGYKPFICNFEGCGKTFNEKGNLKTHMRLHSGVKPYRCMEPGCGESFRFSLNLKQHMKAHDSKADSFYCVLCNSKFSRYTTLEAHITVHKEAIVEKQKCGIDLTQKETLMMEETLQANSNPNSRKNTSCNILTTQDNTLHKEVKPQIKESYNNHDEYNIDKKLIVPNNNEDLSVLNPEIFKGSIDLRWEDEITRMQNFLSKKREITQVMDNSKPQGNSFDDYSYFNFEEKIDEVYFFNSMSRHCYNREYEDIYQLNYMSLMEFLEISRNQLETTNNLFSNITKKLFLSYDTCVKFK